MTDNKTSFVDLGLSEPVLQAVASMGFVEATPVQASAIPVALKGRDVIAQSQTGTGKTAAFGIPIIELVEIDREEIQAIVLTPTRELAQQVARDLTALGKPRGVRVHCIYGGQAISIQMRGLKKGGHVVVGTPGRILDHLSRGTLRLDRVAVAVLDEADEMLDMGFIEDIRRILRRTPRERQTMIFSATIPPPIQRLVKSYTVEPEAINMSTENLLVEETEHRFYEIDRDNEFEALCDLIDYEGIHLGLIFCNTRRMTDALGARLRAAGYRAKALHADMSQDERTRTMEAFRSGDLELLVATDVAARGIDVSDVTHVVNFHIPLNAETYLHRIGRTGRMGRQGTAISLVASSEFHDLYRIQEGVDVWIEPCELPDHGEVQESREWHRLEELATTTRHEELAPYLSEAEYLAERAGAENVIAALLRFIWEGQGREDLARLEPRGSGAGDEELASQLGDTGAREEGMVRLVFSLGRRHQIKPGDMIRAICRYTGCSGDEVGRIHLDERETQVDLPRDHAVMVLRTMDGGFIRGKKVRVVPARPRRRSRREGEPRRASLEEGAVRKRRRRRRSSSGGGGEKETDSAGKRRKEKA